MHEMSKIICVNTSRDMSGVVEVETNSGEARMYQIYPRTSLKFESTYKVVKHSPFIRIDYPEPNDTEQSPTKDETHTYEPDTFEE